MLKPKHLTALLLLALATLFTFAPAPALAQGMNICDRTQAVEDAILAAITPTPACTSVSAGELATITTLDLRSMGIDTLASGDFVGLSALANLGLADNPFTPGTGLPAGIFDDVLDTLGVVALSGGTGLAVDNVGRAAHFVCSHDDANAIIAATLGTPHCLRITTTQFNEALQRMDATLSGLTLTAGTLEPTFDSGTTSYTASVANSVTRVTVTPTAGSNSALVRVNGTIAVATIDLEPPGTATPITIVVTAATNAMMTYTVDVTRAAVPAAALAGTLTEANLFAATAPTVTVTLANTEYAATGTLTQSHFTVADTVTGTVSVSDFTRDSSTVATLTLEHSGEDITTAGTLSVTLAAAGHTGSGVLTTSTIPITASTGTNVCGRTALVHEEIVTRSTASECTSITDLATIGTLDFTQMNPGGGLTAVVSGDFAGLAGLETLLFLRNSLTTLPEDIFAGLSALTTLRFNQNTLRTLPEGVFAGLSSLVELNLFSNNLNTLPVGVFAGLTSVERLYINNNAFTSLPADIFDDGLTSLMDLALHGNPFTAGTGLPAGIFDEVLDTLRDVALGGSDGLAVDLVGRAAHFVCSRTDVAAIVTFTSAAHCLRVTAAELNTYLAMTDATLSGLTLSAGTLDPAFDSATTTYTVSVANSVASVTVTPTATNAGATIAVNGGIATTAIDLPPTGTAVPIAIVVTAADTATRMTYTVTATRAMATTTPAAALAGTLTEANLFAATAPTVTVTLANTEYAATGTLVQSHFTVADDVAGTVSVSGFNRDSNTEATLTLAYDNMDITANGTLSVTLAAAGHTGTGALITNTIPITASAGVNICGRTAQVRDEIVFRSSATECTSITDLASITFLDLNGPDIATPIASLQPGDFAGLSALENLRLPRNNLTTLPATIFAGLSALEILSLGLNDLEALPDNIFANLTALQQLNLDGNDLVALPATIFAGLTALQELRLNDNDLEALPATIFDGLGSLATLRMFNNPFTPATGLPAGIFDDVLDTLGPIATTGSPLFQIDQTVRDAHFICSRPDFAAIVTVTTGVDDCLRITTAQLNTAIPLVDATLSGLTLSPGTLNPAFESAITTYAVDVTNGISSVTVMPTATQSGATIAVNGGSAATAINLPPPGTAVPIAIVVTAADGTTIMTYTVNVTRSTSTTPGSMLAGTLTEANLFASAAPTVTVTLANTEYAATGTLVQSHFTVADDVAGTVSVSGFNRDSNTVATLTLAYDNVDITANGTLSVTLAAAGHTGTGALITNTISITASAGVNICGRTAQVQTAILTASDDTECTSVTDLAMITDLNAFDMRIVALQSGDFAGLTGLTTLDLSDNNIVTLPADIFAGLTALQTLIFINNRGLTTLPADVFDGLTALTILELGNNGFTALPTDIFDGLTALEDLSLFSNGLTGLPADIFEGLDRLMNLGLDGNDFTAETGLPSGVFDPVLDTLGAIATSGVTGFVIDDTVRAAHFVCSRPDFAAIVMATTGVTDCLRVTAAEFDAYLASMPAAALAGTLTEANLFASAAPTVTVTLANTEYAATGTLAQSHFTVADDVAGTVSVSGFNRDSNTVATLTLAYDNVDITTNGMLSVTLAAAGHTDTGDLTNTIPITASTGTNVCGRTAQVRDEIVVRSSADECTSVGDLATISQLRMDSMRIMALRSGDFAGLTAMTLLRMGGNGLTTLPADIFDSSSALQTLLLNDNQLGSLDPDIFDDLSALVTLRLNNNLLTTLPVGIFVGLDALALLSLSDNNFTAGTGLPEGIFDDVLNTVTTVGPTGFTVDQNVRDAHFVCSRDDFAAIVAATDRVGDCLRITSAQFAAYNRADATLSGLTLSAGTLDPVFASGTMTYTVAVPNNIASVTVTPTATNTGATIEVNGGSAATAIALMPDTAVPIAIVVTAADTTTRLTYTVTATHAASTTAVTVALNANIAGNNVVNIAERTAGFDIAGTVQTGAAVSVTIGTGTARPATVTGTTWTVAIPGNDNEITGTSVTVTATATLAGSPNGTATRMLTVDLTAPTATYSPPATLTVGTAITAIRPGGASSDISAYTVQSGTLPPGLTLDATGGGITGAPTTATASTATVTIRLTDTVGNPADVPITFPAVAMGRQPLTDFAYSALATAVNLAAPTVTAPMGVVTGSSLSYASGDTSICTVDATTGALMLVATGDCVITVTASATTNYLATIDTFTITVVRSGSTVATLTGPLTEASLFASTAPTVTVTLVNTAYEAAPGTLMQSHFTVMDTVAGTVRVSDFTRDSATVATLTLAYSGEDITTAGTLSVTLAAAGHTGADVLTDTIPITASAGMNICDRTPDVRDEIVRRSSADECTSVGDLATITGLNLASFLSTTSLQSGDFAGLTGLTDLNLGFNILNTLPADIFAGLSSLQTLQLDSNQFSTLPPNIFADLSSLVTLNLHGNNQLQQLPAGIFTGLSSLRFLSLQGAQFTAGTGLPAGIFDDILDTLGSGSEFTVDQRVINAHFVCSRDDANAIVAATDGVDDCLRISSTQFNIAVALVEADATLSGLTLSDGALAPPFAADTTTYTVSVADSVTDVTVTPTATNAGATITVNAAAVTSGSPSDVITLMAPGTPLAIPIVVTAADGTTTQTYTVTVTRAAAGSTPNFDSALPLAPQIYTVGFDVGTVTLPAATGGNAPLTYTLAPALPTGLTFDAANRQITGAPTATQLETAYTLTATDAAASDTFTFMLIVNPAVPSATLAAPTALTGANLATATVTVTLENTTYADASALGPDDFRLTATIAGTVSVRAGGVTRTSSTVATLALAHSGETIPDSGTLSVTVLASAHDGTDDLFAGRVPITVTNEDEQLEELTEELNEQVLPQVFLKLADVGSRLIADRLSAGAIVGGGTIISQAHDGEAGSSGLMAQLGQWLSGDAAEVELSRRLQNLDDFKLRDFIDGLSFAADGEQVGMAGGSLYGIGNYTRLSGDEDGVDWDGDLYSGYVGLDTRLRNGALAGVLLSYSKGEFEYVDTVGDEGEYDLDISSVNPYIGWSLSEDLDVWASVGYGIGEVELNDNNGSRSSSDLSVGSVSVGASGRLVVSDELIAGGRSELHLRGDGSASQVDFDRSDAGFTDVSSHRLRLIVEASHLRSGASGSVRSGLELGVRHDGGDGQDDQGLELGGSIEWSNTRGLTLSGRTRVLTLADYDEWGVSGILRLSPGQGGRGLSFSLSPGYGRDDSGTEQLWQRGASAVSSAQTARLRMDGEVGYGLWLLGGTVQPYVGASLLQGGDSRQRMGARLEFGRGVQLELEGSRAAAEHRIELQWQWNW